MRRSPTNRSKAPSWPIVIVGGTQRIPGRENMAGVEAETQPIGLAEAIEDHRKMLEAPAQGGALAGGGFQQAADCQPAGLGMDFIQCPGNPAEAGFFVAGGVGSGVGHDERDPQCLGPAATRR